MADRSPSSSLEVERRKPPVRRNAQPQPISVAEVQPIAKNEPAPQTTPEIVVEQLLERKKSRSKSRSRSPYHRRSNRSPGRDSRDDHRKDDYRRGGNRNERSERSQRSERSERSVRSERSERSTFKDDSRRELDRFDRPDSRQNERHFRPDEQRRSERANQGYVTQEDSHQKKDFKINTQQPSSRVNARREYEQQYGKKDEGNRNEDDKRKKKEDPDIIKEEPCWVQSGILARFQNDLNGVTLKFTRPMDAEKPKEKWTLFPFKDTQTFEKVNLRGDNAFLIGKDPRVAIILCENPTVSSQHAVIQFREIKKMDYAQSVYTSEIRPYIMDLESTNGTMLNGEKIEAAKYIQLLPNDVLRFGLSTRDYVLIKEK